MSLDNHHRSGNKPSTPLHPAEFTALSPDVEQHAEHSLEQGFDTVASAIEAIRNGEMVIVADDEDRENEGDLVCAAEKTTPELINFMAQEGRGLICLAMAPEWCDRLELPPMVVGGTGDTMGTAFTVSVDAHPKYGVTTGISAWDRATTIRVAVAPDAVPADLRRPGHIFPLRAKPGGVLERVGQTEASVDLARMAGLTPAGVICEILNPDGTMARRTQLFELAKRFNLRFITVAQLIAYRLQQEQTVIRRSVAQLPTVFGEFTVVAYENTLDGTEHLALTVGNLTSTEDDPSENAPLVRVHSECLTGDILASLRCDCGFQLHAALEQIQKAGKGVLVYLRRHEGRGIGLVNKIKAYALQDDGLDTVEANQAMGFPPDLRHYGIGAQILRDLGVRRFQLLTNNPRKIRGLDGYGLSILNRVPLETGNTEENRNYLLAKKLKLGHWLQVEAPR
ncbi:MAG: bifunctional 3,4-dihydroxy-2-butanone-4-phosphate synthase/GTP cyclohydrolase II [Candidatus Melainabacteria bacterium]|nr:bifunctional 3,4-dihydroxy-2-butanone-4-phosphate synthase/GTP cyclohydrolase II [Candidatus Melainabacteria bacterium]